MAKKLQILRGTTAQNDAYTGSVGELTMDTEKVEVRIHDGTTQGGKIIGSSGGSMPDRYVESINGWTGNVFLGAHEIGTYTSDEIDEKIAEAPASFPILFHTWSDCIMNNQSWLRADTFSWHSGDTYKAAYNRLVDGAMRPTMYAWSSSSYVFYTLTDTPAIGDDVYFIDKTYGVSKVLSVSGNTITFEHHRTGETVTATRSPSDDTNALAYGLNESTETIGGVTITYYRSEDGRKICLPDQEAKVLELYNSTGVAWYYILDTENKRFKLPRTKYGFTGLRDEVGNYVLESLPTHTHTRGSMNITGGFNSQTGLLNIGSVSGAFSRGNVGTGYYGGSSQNNFAGSVDFDASRSWTGSTSEPDNSVYGSGKPVQQRATQMYLYFYAGNFEQSAIEQTAGLNAELFNGKADRDLNNVPSNYDYVVATQAGTSSNNYTWYRKYKSGWVEMGGRFPNQSGTGQIKLSATLPIPTTGTHALSTPEYVSGESVVVVTTYASGTTIQAVIEKNNSGNTNYTTASARWIAYGYAA